MRALRIIQHPCFALNRCDKNIQQGIFTYSRYSLTVSRMLLALTVVIGITKLFTTFYMQGKLQSTHCHMVITDVLYCHLMSRDIFQ